MPVLLQNPIERIWQHLAPPGPIVVHIGAPEVELVRDILTVEYVGKMLAAFGRLVVSLA